MTEKEKMLRGDLYDAADPQLVLERRRARKLTQALSESHDEDQAKRELIIADLFGSVGQGGLD